MPSIKKLHVGFDIDAEVFMKLLQHGSTAMNIQVYEDTPKVKKEDRKLLPAPENASLRMIVLNYLREHKDRSVPLPEIMELCVSHGHPKQSVYAVMNALCIRKQAKRTTKGVYKIAAGGLNE